MIEYGSGNGTVAKPGYTCFYPHNPDREDSIMCDRVAPHLGRHAAWNANNRRVYWEHE